MILISPITKGPASSHEFNSLIHSIHEDLKTLFEAVNTNEESLKETLLIYTCENYFLKQQLDILNLKVKEVKEIANNIIAGSDVKVLYGSFKDMMYPNVTFEHGIVTLPAGSKNSKLTFETEDNIYIPKTLNLQITESYDGITYTEVDASTNFLERKYWVRTVRLNENTGVNKIYCKIRITVPTEILNNIYSNVLKIVPFPFYGTSVDDIQYKNTAGNWASIEYTGPLTIFEDTDITELEISISQSNYFTDGEGYRVFVYGLKELGLYYYDFLSEGSLVVPFSIANTSVYFDTIFEPEEIDGVSYQLYLDPSLTREIWFNENILTNVQTVYLKINLAKTDPTPILKEVKLQFTTKS